VKNSFKLLAIGASLFIAAAGCNKSKTTNPAQAFQAASAEVKARWQEATEAVATNNYATAVLTLRKLQMDPSLTPEQLTIVGNQMMSFTEKLAIAEQKGDPDAKKAMEEIRQRWRSP
jgi:hypothetical protein